MTGDWQRLLREASRLRAAGRVEEAIAAYRQLLAVNPDLPDSWFNLGWLQRQARRFEDALASYQQALDRGVSQPEEVHLNRAAIYSEYLSQPHDSVSELRAAIGIKPDYVQAWLNLGNVQEDLGERELAREAYQRVLEIEPDNTLALARLATSSLDRGLERKLRERIARPDATVAQRAGLGFALAALLDSAGEYDQAFAAATAANVANKAAGGSRAVYDRAAQERLVDRLIETFDRPAAGSDNEQSPVFICGMYRSGSTLIEQIVAGHSQVTAAGELDLIPSLVAGIRGYPEAVRAASTDQVRQWREFYLAALQARFTEGCVVTDKRPDNFLHVGLIKTIFPTAKIVHTRRDPLDNLLSLYFLHLDPSMAYALDLEDAAHWYGQYRRLMAHWDSVYARDIHEVDYEALVADPEPVVRALLEFLGLEWEAACLHFHRSGRAVRTASVWQVREPLYKRSSGRWRNYAKPLEPLRAALDAQGRVTA